MRRCREVGVTRSIEERFLHCVGRHLRGSEGGKKRRPTPVEMTRVVDGWGIGGRCLNGSRFIRTGQELRFLGAMRVILLVSHDNGNYTKGQKISDDGQPFGAGRRG